MKELLPVAPASIRVAAFDFAIKGIEPLSAMAEQKYGWCATIEQAIYVDFNTRPSKVLDTMLHEVLHAMYWAYGMQDEDKEERMVGTMATAWTQVWRDNPGLLAWVQAMCALLAKQQAAPAP